MDTDAAAPAAAAAVAAVVEDGGPVRLHVGHLTRNVTEAHLREIFGCYGKLRGVDLALDRAVNLPRCAGGREAECCVPVCLCG